MNVEGFIQLANSPPALRFLIIGGYAVGAHGHPRATFDFDFLVLKDDRSAWIEKLLQQGLKKIADTNAFAQFAQQEGDGLDLMFVNAATFERMWNGSQPRSFGVTEARVPSLDHLIALKLHALKQKLPHRTSQDAEDMEILIRRNALDISQPNYEKLFLKYGAAKSTKRSCESCAIDSIADLEFPVDPDFHPLPPLVSMEVMIERNAQFREWFPPRHSH